jgi:hypothetical protein
MSYDELEPFLATSRLSFNVQLPANSTAGQSNLLVVDTPPYMARPWTVNLLGFRYAQGPILGPPGATQAVSLTTATNDNATTGANAVKLRTSWGVDGAVEVALMDYPTHGGAIQLSAGIIRVDVLIDGFVGSTGATPPLIGGYLSPSPKGSVNALTNPQYTYPTRNITGLSGTTFLIPKRATAFRVWQIDQVITPDVDVAQFDVAGTLIEYDGRLNSTGLAGAPVNYGEINSSDWVPVNNHAQYVTLVNTTATARSYSVTFLLDLG